MTERKRIVVGVAGGIAAYKACTVVRQLTEAGHAVRVVPTESALKFIGAATFEALSGNPVHTGVFENVDEVPHVRIGQEADLVVVAPATANMLAKMANGIADNLATTLLLATDKPVLAVPAMNVRMWHHAATRRNIAQLKADGVLIMEPDSGEMACGAFGKGRLPEPEAIAAEITRLLARPLPADPLAGQPDFEGPDAPLAGRHVLVTAGPTHEPIAPVRYIANRSSGKQGFAVAAAAARAGARVTLVAGPVHLPTPAGVDRIDVETAREMMAAVEAALPADAAIMVAAVADWRTADAADQKLKKDGSGKPAPLPLVENPDILATLGKHAKRPALLVGFAAETQKVAEHARAKLARKGADWIVANDVSGPPGSSVMGGDSNSVHIVSGDGVESWENLPKDAGATRLIEKVADALSPRSD